MQFTTSLNRKWWYMSCQMCVYASFVMAGGIACIQSYGCHCVIVLCIIIIDLTIGVYLYLVYIYINL